MSRAVLEAYRRGEEDEAMGPLVLVDGRGEPVGRIRRGDAAIFYDIRGEREIELTEALTDPAFDRFTAERLELDFATMIRYDPKLRVRVAFPPEEEISGTLTETLSRQGLRQLKICESEKEVHVSFFFNGKNRAFFPGEERWVVESPRDAGDYSGHPDMSAETVSETVLNALRQETYAFILVNYANVDVVGHCENPNAVILAVERVDRELAKVVTVARKLGVTTVVTADHGSAEKWFYPDGAIDTGHTSSPVPFAVVPAEGRPPVELEPEGSLTDVAPTALALMHLPAPPEMTGRPLVRGPVPEEYGPVLMIILDGWGLGADPKVDLIHAAKTPFMDSLLASFPHARLAASGEAVGMPAGTVGNSEAGHLHLGAGRPVLSDRVRIDRALADGSFAANDSFLACMRGARERKALLHLIGIVSFYSSHGSLKHLFALMDMAKAEGLRDVCIHGFLGRRGERPESGAIYVAQVEEYARQIGLGRMVSVLGRFWSLDREGNWDRIGKTYDLLVRGQGTKVPDR